MSMRPKRPSKQSGVIDFHLREIAVVPEKHIRTNKSSYVKSLWLFGNTKEKHSVAIRVKDFYPYLFVRDPGSIDLQEMQDDLNDMLRPWENGPDIVRNMTRCHKTNVIGFSDDEKHTFIRIEYSNDANTRSLVKALSKDHVVYHHDWGVENLFLNETGISMQSWISVKGRVDYSSAVLTTCHIELCVFDWRKNICKITAQCVVPPILCCSLRMRARSHKANIDNADARKKNSIPSPDYDPIIFISVQIYWMCDEENVSSFNLHGDECEILKNLEDIFKSHDVDCFVYLSDNCDVLQYITRRKSDVCLSKFLNYTSTLFKSNDHYYGLKHYGRSRLDIQAALKKMMIEPKLDEYTLKDAIFHKSIVRSVPDEEMRFFSFTQCSYMKFETVVQECTKENYWLRCVEQHNYMLLGFVEISAASYTQLTVAIMNGQQIRVWKKLINEFHSENLIVNKEVLDTPPLIIRRNVKNTSFVDPPELENVSIGKQKVSTKANVFDLFGNIVQEKKQTKKKKYEGGYVCAPISGFYENPTFTFDFSAHYPSIIQAHNICYMRLVWDKKYLEDDTFVKTYVPIQPKDEKNMVDCIVLIKGKKTGSNTIQPARTVLCKIIADVGEQRKAVKKQMKLDSNDTFLYNSLDAKQLSCKVFQNAVYGFLGVEHNALLACPVLMATVCKIGQHMTKTVRHHMISKYSACVVYGDTDSVMVQFPKPCDRKITFDKLMKLYYDMASAVAHETTSLFEQPCKLEFESIKMPYILYKKKNYAALEYGSEPLSWTKKPKLSIKGLAFKKRDRCHFVRNCGQRVIQLLLESREREVVLFLTKSINDLTNNRVPISDLHITCQVQKLSDYKSESLIQLEVVKKIQKRNGIFIEPGSRISYVVIEGDGKLYKRGEEITYCIKNNLKIDLEYYFEKQFLKAIEPLLQFHPHINITKLKTSARHDLRRRRRNIMSLQSMAKKSKIK